MTHLQGQDPPGATPLEDEDLDGLIPTFVATRGDLNVVEQANIEKATRWAFRGQARTRIEDLLSVTFAVGLHRRMFGEVWRWAGQQRPRETNIGVEPSRITTEMKVLLDDAMFWHGHDTFSASERAVRMHHRLVSVHPFRNGNGRHSRFLADLYLHEIGAKQLSWGARQNLII
ncbi:MAG: fic, partial [Actinomycetia bacterium]|nr:fic [Actinomycetes bacterium]